jgi:hypothetical protein
VRVCVGGCKRERERERIVTQKINERKKSRQGFLSFTLSPPPSLETSPSLRTLRPRSGSDGWTTATWNKKPLFSGRTEFVRALFFWVSIFSNWLFRNCVFFSCNSSMYT